jgi:hypothetical protein
MAGVLHGCADPLSRLDIRQGRHPYNSGRIWSEVVAEHQAEEHDARLEYWRKNKDHIIRHENERAERYKSRIEPAHHQEQS